VYPEEARRAGVQGVVQFTALVGKDGVVKDLTLVSGHPLLVPAAREAFKSWLFQPTIIDGEAVEFTSQLSMTFSMNQ
jgi:protein TonB